jgi:hypothetical protein
MLIVKNLKKQDRQDRLRRQDHKGVAPILPALADPVYPVLFLYKHYNKFFMHNP